MTTIQVLADVILDSRILVAGIKGKSNRKNTRVTVASGAEFINADWDRSLREWDLATAPLIRADWEYVETIFEITDAGALGFLMRDPKDDSVVAGQGVAYGTATAGVYQLYKRYLHAASGRSKDRKITRPIYNNHYLYIADVFQDPATYTLDVTTGQATIPSNPPPADVTWIGNFHVPVHFRDDFLGWDLIVPCPSAEGRWISASEVILKEVRE